MSHTPKISASRSKAEEAVPETAAWDRHVRWLAPVSIGILVLATVFIWWQGQQRNSRIQVFQAYMDASSPVEPLPAAEQATQLQNVALAYPNEPEAPMALIQAGALLFNEGDYEGALALYEQFLEEYPQHPLKENPAWGALHCQEALGNLDAALAGFTAYTEDDLLYPQARLAVARIYEKRNQWTEARDLYETVLDTMPDTPWARQAEVFLQQARLQADKAGADESDVSEMPKSPEQE